jgi:hypothetical protein
MKKYLIITILFCSCHFKYVYYDYYDRKKELQHEWDSLDNLSNCHCSDSFKNDVYKKMAVINKIEMVDKTIDSITIVHDQ